MAGKIKFDYDEEEDILFIYDPERKSFGSVELGGNVIIDFDGKKRVVALEFLDATESLSSLTGKKITKKMLSGIKQAKFLAETKKGMLIIKFIILCAEKPIESMLTMTALNYRSHAMAAFA